MHTIGFLRRRPDVFRFFRYTAHPDETLFNSIIASSPLSRRVHDTSLTYTDWSQDDAHPAILTSTDFDTVSRSDFLFARKFDMQKDAAILDLIDERILAGEGQPIANNQLLKGRVRF
jgi:hypothetical protein